MTQLNLAALADQVRNGLTRAFPSLTRDQVDDLTQYALVATWRGMSRCPSLGSSGKEGQVERYRYAMRCARNRHCSALRRRYAVHFVSLSEKPGDEFECSRPRGGRSRTGPEAVDEADEAQAQAASIRRVLHHLSPQERTLVEVTLRGEEPSVVMPLNCQRVRVLRAKAVSKLRELVGTGRRPAA